MAAKNNRRTSAKAGMHGLAIMPFPFLNAWNWGAMTPTCALGAALVLSRLNLELYRAMLDARRNGVRQQQDAFLNGIETELNPPQNERSANARQTAPQATSQTTSRRAAAPRNGAPTDAAPRRSKTSPKVRPTNSSNGSRPEAQA